MFVRYTVTPTIFSQLLLLSSRIQRTFWNTLRTCGQMP